jgi:hypothetical protein
MASPGVGRAVAALIVLVWACPAWTQTHDADFPEQMAAINRCHVEHIKSGKPPAPDRWGDKNFWACMGSQGFQFCGNCQIFRYSGGPCRNDKNNAPDRATCWRPRGSSDADFPLQMKEINACYIEHKRESLLPGTSAELRRCMREHGYQFCGHCDIDGRDCRLLELGAHRPDCYRLIGRVNERGYPTDDSHPSKTEREWDDTVERLIQKWTSLSSACRTPILDERRCDEFKMTEDILRDSHCIKITKNDAHWECPRLKDLPKGD